MTSDHKARYVSLYIFQTREQREDWEKQTTAIYAQLSGHTDVRKLKGEECAMCKGNGVIEVEEDDGK